MVIISRDQAICIFYCEPYNEENVTKFSKILDDLKNVEICYGENPKRPMLMCTKTIDGNPFDFHYYKSNCALNEEREYEKKKETEETERVALNTIPQLLQFLNAVYLAENPQSSMYELKVVSMKNILAKIWDNSVLFEDKSIKSFTKWCEGKNLSFFSVPSKRLHNLYGERVSVRSLYVLKDQYTNSIKKDIIYACTEYQNYIIKLKEEGYTVIGYCRKSRSTTETIDKKILSLQKQIGNLKTRSLVDKVYVSVNCDSKERITNRDVNSSSSALELKGLDGNMQDLIKYLLTAKKICLVTIDSAGLTSDVGDLISFLREYPNIEKILIDNLPHTNQTHAINCAEAIESPDKFLSMFNGRHELYHRSK
ncbi:hypothetical protein K501DRAFT_334769 [Backusella circina FSU 941]|nr:hypothetical protein K501DRAFT_334769 [Backusella circina FSU 941]